MKKLTNEQKIFHTLRIACAMCFIGHGAFGIITKEIWCNYFGIFGIEQHAAYQLMPWVGTIDILMGALILFYPVRAVFAWLIIWGTITALLRPLSGEPLPEFFERAGNYGAPFMLLVLMMLGEKKKPQLLARASGDFSLNEDDNWKIALGLRIVAFLLIAGHAWLNLLAKKSLLEQYGSMGFSDPYIISQFVGAMELAAAVLILLKPLPALVLVLVLWKMSSELFYPTHELFEWIERGGSYGVLLALWFVLKQNSFAPSINNKQASSTYLFKMRSLRIN